MFFPGDPLNYPTNAQGAIRRYEANRAPDTFDNKNFKLGDEWLDTSLNEWYKLVANPQGVADWCNICQSAGATESFLPDSGTTPVVPDGANQVTMTGTNGIEVIGGLNTLTFDFTGGGAGTVTGFLPDAGTSPVVPDGAGEVTLTGGPTLTQTIETTGSLNTVTWDLVTNLPGDRCFTCPSPNEAEFCWDCTLRCTSLRGFSTGFAGSEWFTCQAGVQTVDASTVTLATIPVQDFTNITLQGNLAARRELNTAAITQTIIYGARRNGGGAIEMSSSEGHFLSDGPGTVMMDAIVSGNDILITATGEAATVWNWVLTYSYMTLKTNA